MSKKLYQTSDGTKFYHEQDAKNHALSLEDRKVIEVTDSKSATAEEQLTVDGKSKTDKKSDVELIAEIEQVETLEQLDTYEVHKQVTVKTAVEKRRSELTANIEVNSEENLVNSEQLTVDSEEEQEDVKEDKGE